MCPENKLLPRNKLCKVDKEKMENGLIPNKLTVLVDVEAEDKS